MKKTILFLFALAASICCAGQSTSLSQGPLSEGKDMFRESLQVGSKLYYAQSSNSSNEEDVTWHVNGMLAKSNSITRSSTTYTYSGGVCRDTQNEMVPIHYCYVNYSYSIGLTECVNQGAICYYDSYWNLVDAFPVSCKAFCAN